MKGFSFTGLDFSFHGVINSRGDFKIFSYVDFIFNGS